MVTLPQGNNDVYPLPGPDRACGIAGETPDVRLVRADLAAFRTGLLPVVGRLFGLFLLSDPQFLADPQFAEEYRYLNLRYGASSRSTDEDSFYLGPYERFNALARTLLGQIFPRMELGRPWGVHDSTFRAAVGMGKTTASELFFATYDITLVARSPQMPTARTLMRAASDVRDYVRRPLDLKDGNRPSVDAFLALFGN